MCSVIAAGGTFVETAVLDMLSSIAVLDAGSANLLKCQTLPAAVVVHGQDGVATVFAMESSIVLQNM